MLRFKRGQRTFLAEKLGDLANVAAGAFIFGQALSGSRFSATLVLVDVVVWIVVTFVAVVFAAAEEL